MKGVCESTLQVVCNYSNKGLIVINVPEGTWKCCESGDSNSSLGALIVLGVRRWPKEGRIGGPPIQPESPQLCQWYILRILRLQEKLKTSGSHSSFLRSTK